MSDDLRRVKIQWEQRIEHMLTRPLFYSGNSQAFEVAFYTAICAWSLMEQVGGRPWDGTLSTVWRHTLKAEEEARNQTYDPQMSAFHRIRDAYGDRLEVDDCIPFYRRIWERIRDPIERLASISEDEG